MDQNAEFSSTGDTLGATVVITHRVRDGRQAEYEEWMNEIGPAVSITRMVLQPLRLNTSAGSIMAPGACPCPKSPQSATRIEQP